MTQTTQIIRLVTAFAKTSELSTKTVSRYMSGNGDFCDRLERGHDITTRRAARVVQRLSDHWPADLDWPADIPRPAPTVSPSPDPDHGEAA